MNHSLVQLRRMGRAGLVVLFATLGPAVGAAVIAGPVVEHADLLRAGDAGVVAAMMLAAVLGCALCVLPTHAASLTLGFALGAWWGPTAAVASVVLAACVGYAALSRLAGPGAVDALRARPKWAAVYDALASAPRQGDAPHATGRALRVAVLLALLRLSPVMPFGATNALMAALRVPMGWFVLGTAVGMLPRVAAVALLGAGLSRLDLSTAAGPWVLAVGVAATIVVTLAIGWIGRAAWRRATASDQTEPRSPVPNPPSAPTPGTAPAPAGA